MKIAQISDTHLDLEDRHPHGVDVWSNARWALESARANDADLIVLSGDLALRSGAARLYAEIASMLDRLAVPYLVMPGNHDDRSLFADAFGRRYVQSARETLDRAVLVAGLPMYFLDSSDTRIDPLGLAWIDMQLWAHRDAARRGELPKTVPLWIHHPIITGFHRYMDENYRLENASDVIDILSRYSEELDIAVYCGHYHIEDERLAAGVTQYVCPSLYVQIDPMNADFSVLSRVPGYRFIVIGEEDAPINRVVYREEARP